ncbi:hypothetical protein BDW02DRAFT_554848 [Decorospora gaudefroyi]|uniref:Mannosyltransferase n=1 Tax=Decorospora gaudefroyi TaxID=184978 RepID=A0A6A5K8S1_9PLEO|nr:hypothetical protein BDW02DRAFT_554848 [Decorospora gaudefroyi]
MAPTPPRAHQTRRTPAGKAPQLTATASFCLFAAANLIAAFFSPIQDCDEVFNYWEPSHYLNHGYGLQTWEYSPEYAIRSWTYTGIHSLLIWLAMLPTQLLDFQRSKVAGFYFLRAVLAVTCAFCQTRMYSVIQRTFNARVATFFTIIMVISPGMYHAAPAYLPSSFAMYTTMLGFASFMDWSGGFMRTTQGITWIAVGSALGWPFAGALVLPWVAEDMIAGFRAGRIDLSFWRVLKGAGSALVLLATQTAIDSFFYRKLVCVPLNIVLYNVFSGGSRGPDIYGVEPWHFYIRNLALNFNIWFFLALAALPMVLIQHLIFEKSGPKRILMRSVVFVSPFYLWLAIFTVQPHKEERFMYPAYPALALNAALTFHLLLANFGSTDPRHLVSKIPPQVKLAIVGVPLLLSFNIGMLRTIGTLTAYSAPLNVYKPLFDPTVARPGDTVCLGKEWYRFPSSFNLPQGVRSKFIKSEFSGLLPGEFSQSGTGLGLFPGTWIIPPGMNDENKEDPGKYVDVDQCDFMVDSRLPGTSPTALEPDYIADTVHWETLKCVPFLDVSQTHILGRLVWIPDLPFIPDRLRRKWGAYSILRTCAQMHRIVSKGPSCVLSLRMVCHTNRVGYCFPRLVWKINHYRQHWRDPHIFGDCYRSNLTCTYVHTVNKGKHVARTAQHHCTKAHSKLNTTLKNTGIQPKAALYAFLLFITFIWLIITITRYLRAHKQNSRPNTPNLEKRSAFKAPERPLGVWPPSAFTRPPATPYPNWSLTSTKSLPYRPFRRGPKYNITMGLRTMPWDNWLELDNEYLKYHTLKASRLDMRGKKACQTDPRAHPAALELLSEFVSYLPQRYPSLFAATAVGMRNVATGEEFDVQALTRNGQVEDPMALCARMVQDDLAIMVEGEDGQYYLLAGAILLAGFWRLQDKFGMGLREIHTSGHVPGFEEKLERGMTNFFRRIQPENPVVRNNYFIQVDDQLAWSESIGSEDSEGIGWFSAEKNKAIHNHYFRSERQSLRRLPKTGGVVFTIRTYFHPITSIAQEPYVPGRLASAVRSWGDDVSRYKGKERYGDVLLEYLDAMHGKQVEEGVVREGGEEELENGYPF